MKRPITKKELLKNLRPIGTIIKIPIESSISSTDTTELNFHYTLWKIIKYRSITTVNGKIILAEEIEYIGKE